MSTQPSGRLPPKTPSAKRVLFLLEAIWRGNKAAMARDIGVSHSVVNKISYGLQAPGRKFLDALSAHPRVNPVWLHDGTGEPLRGAGTPAESAAAGLLPVADQVLPGPPASHRGVVKPGLDLLSPAWFRPSRYLVRVGADWPLIRDPEARVAEGDLLLVETEPVWLENPAVLVGRLVAVDAGSAGLHVVTSAALAKEELPKPTERDREREEFLRRFGKPARGLQFDDADTPVEASSPGTPPWKVLGVVLLKIRM